jgi:hypothetical protein
MVGFARVASFWFGRTYIILTLKMDDAFMDAAFIELKKSFQRNILKQDAPTEAEMFITQIFKCSGGRYGIPKPSDKPLYEKEYPNLKDALAGHKEIVSLFFSGKFKLPKR